VIDIWEDPNTVKFRNYSDVQSYSIPQLVQDLNEAHGKIRNLKTLIKVGGWLLAASWAVNLIMLKFLLDRLALK
jgi:hypothetical protein